MVTYRKLKQLYCRLLHIDTRGDVVQQAKDVVQDLGDEKLEYYLTLEGMESTGEVLEDNPVEYSQDKDLWDEVRSSKVIEILANAKPEVDSVPDTVAA